MNWQCRRYLLAAFFLRVLTISVEFWYRCKTFECMCAEIILWFAIKDQLQVCPYSSISGMKFSSQKIVIFNYLLLIIRNKDALFSSGIWLVDKFSSNSKSKLFTVVLISSLETI